jgi:hypothetical protein
MLDGNVEGWGSGGAFYGRQQHKSPETKVSVAGHRAGMVEPEDEMKDGSQESAEIAVPTFVTRSGD